MRSNLWIFAAGSVALLSACSSAPTTNDPSEAQVENTTAGLTGPQLGEIPAEEVAAFRHGAHGHPGAQRLATGQYVTPPALVGAVQQFLNPGLPAYPNF